MSAARASISKFQLFYLIIQSQIGIGLLSLPSDMQQSVDGDGWISTLIAGAAVQLLLIIYWLLYKRLPNYNFPEMTIKLFGNIAGKAYNIFFGVCCLIIAGLSSTLYIEMINMWLLPHTPNWALLILIVATCLFLVLEDIRIISRFLVVTSFLFVILILMSFLDWTKELHFSYLLPIGKSGLLDIVKGSHHTFLSMIGFEIVLFAFSYVKSDTRGLLKVISFANLFVTILYTYFVLICLVSFSPNALKQLKSPILFMFKGFDYRMVERLDLIFLSLWIVPMTTSIIAYLYMAGKSLSHDQRSYRKSIMFSSVVIVIVGQYLSTLEQLDQVSQWIQNSYFVVIGVVPALMLLLSYSFKKHSKRCPS